MIDEDLRSHYSRLRPGPDAERRILTALAGVPPRHAVRTRLAVAGSVAAVGAVSAAVTLLPQGDHPAAGGPTTSRPSTTVVEPSRPAPALQPVTPQVVVQNLIRLVSPKGTVTHPTGRAVGNSAVGEIKFDDGHGVAQLDVALTWRDAGPGQVEPSPDICSGGSQCRYVGDWQVETSQGLEYPQGHANNSTEWGARAFRAKDGLEVDITEWNAAAPKDSPISRIAPPFTINELITMATSPTWHATASAQTIAAAAGLFTPDPMPTGS